MSLKQLLSYQTILYTEAADEVIPIIISTTKGRWRLPRRFRAASDDICGEVTLDFGYLLLDLATLDRQTCMTNFLAHIPTCWRYKACSS